MKVENDVPGSSSLLAKIISTFTIFAISPYGLCGRKATLKKGYPRRFRMKQAFSRYVPCSVCVIS